jgi:hypothetical protein
MKMGSSTKITKYDLDDSVLEGIATEEFVTEQLSSMKTETWTFEMSDGSTITKEVVIGS